MKRMQTNRLSLREVEPDDAAFMLSVLNDPGFIQYIGDRGVHTQQQAERYISEKMLASYQQYGFGMYVVVRNSDSQAIGICGLVRRPGLDDVDIGFAFLPEFCGHGYALESAQAVMMHAQNDLKLKRVVAITSADNHSSIRLLDKLGYQYDKMIGLPDSDDQVRLFVWSSDSESGTD